MNEFQRLVVSMVLGVALEAVKRDADGRPLCRWCERPVKPPKHTLCGDPECVHQYRLRSDAGYLRAVVFERDGGVCALCGLDTAKAQGQAADCWFAGRRAEAEALCDFYGVPRWRVLGSWWDADHITPVVEGGGECDTANIRTVCIPCHKRVTAELAQRRARLRRGGIR